MAYPAPMSDYLLQSQADELFEPADPEPMVRPVTMLDSLVGWLATAGILFLLAGSLVIAGLVWLFNLLLAPAAPDEGVGE